MKIRHFLPLLSLVFLFAALVAGCGQEPPKKEIVRFVRTMKIEKPSDVAARSFPGRAKAVQEVNLSFRVSGPLVERPVNVGSKVSRGDLVAKIDPRDFQVNLNDAMGKLAKAKSDMVRASKDYQRIVNIRKEDPGAASESMLDKAKDAMDSAKANVKSFTASVDAARDALNYSKLNAPFDGTIVATYVENYEYVKAQQNIVRLIDNSKVEMVVNIPESLISAAEYVTKVYVSFDTHPDTKISATIKEVGTEASRTTRTYPVTLIMEQPDNFKILSGMAGKTVGVEGNFPGDMGKKHFVIPPSATFSEEGEDKTWVWIVDKQNTTVSKQEVTIGDLTDHGVKILSGLNEGDLIVTAGVHYLKEGLKVKISQEGK